MHISGSLACHFGLFCNAKWPTLHHKQALNAALLHLFFLHTHALRSGNALSNSMLAVACKNTQKTAASITSCILLALSEANNHANIVCVATFYSLLTVF